MNWLNQDNSNQMYKVIRYNVSTSKFNLEINSEKEKVMGFIAKFVNSNGEPIKLCESDSYLSIDRYIEGDFLKYEMEEKFSCDMNHYTKHQQFMNNLPPSDVLWTYFFKPVTNHKFKLNFELKFVNSFSNEEIILYINLFYQISEKDTPAVCVTKCAKSDYHKGLEEKDKPYILWMYKEMDDDDASNE